MKTLRIGTRGSVLARAQTGIVAEALRRAHPSLRVTEHVFQTRGDRERNRPLPEIGGKGLFTEELERALQNNEIDAAVHSLKDLPTTLPETLCLAAVPKRASPLDALLSREGSVLEALPSRARVGTSSLRRAVQLLRLRSDLSIVPLRGNLDTRIRKLKEGIVDALVVAAAGLERLNRLDEAAELLSTDRILPAVGQGALAVECRAEDTETLRLLAAVHDETTARAVFAERAFLAGLGGGCHVPIAAYAEVVLGGIALTGFVATADGSRSLRGSLFGEDPEAVGKELAGHLLERGAAEILLGVSR